MSSLKQKEKDVLKACLDYLTLKHVFHHRNNTGAIKTERHFIRFGSVGSPDIVAVIKGQYIGFECKASNGNQSADQKIFQGRLEAAGGKYYLVRSLDDLMKVV